MACIDKGACGGTDRAPFLGSVGKGYFIILQKGAVRSNELHPKVERFPG